VFISCQQAGGMRRVLLPLLVIALPGCASWVPSYAPFAGVGAAELASVTVFGRGIADFLYSGVSGRDCSGVRLEQGKTYCAAVEPPPLAPPLCTRSLGTVDCWANPAVLNDLPVHGIADGPSTLTPEQEANRTAYWPKL
jgi:hypothetical protein